MSGSKKEDDLRWWQAAGIMLMGGLFLYGAWVIIVVGEMSARHGNGVHTFDGIEKLVAIMPIGMGALRLWGGASMLMRVLRQ